MQDQSEHITGKTRSTGFQVGARRTFPVSLQKAWRLLTSPHGVRIWLGELPEVHFVPGSQYHLPDGSNGEIRVFSPNSHVRLTWQPIGWSRPTTIQLRVIPSGEKTVIAFHQEHLPGPGERDARRAYYLSVLDELGRKIGSS